MTVYYLEYCTSIYKVIDGCQLKLGGIEISIPFKVFLKYRGLAYSKCSLYPITQKFKAKSRKLSILTIVFFHMISCGRKIYFFTDLLAN
jgi:hypothetical protein